MSIRLLMMALANLALFVAVVFSLGRPEPLPAPAPAAPPLDLASAPASEPPASLASAPASEAPASVPSSEPASSEPIVDPLAFGGLLERELLKPLREQLRPVLMANTFTRVRRTYLHSWSIQAERRGPRSAVVRIVPDQRGATRELSVRAQRGQLLVREGKGQEVTAARWLASARAARPGAEPTGKLGRRETPVQVRPSAQLQRLDAQLQRVVPALRQRLNVIDSERYFSREPRPIDDQPRWQVSVHADGAWRGLLFVRRHGSKPRTWTLRLRGEELLIGLSGGERPVTDWIKTAELADLLPSR